LPQNDRVVFAAQEYSFLKGKFREKLVDEFPTSFLLNLVRFQKEGSS
jgi:hypothetical protein